MSDSMPAFFEKSNTNQKYWEKKIIDKNRFQITKVGARCENCSRDRGEDVFKSVRVEYETFKGRDGIERTEFSWINTKCGCATFVIYKNGRVSITAKEPYNKAVRQFDDIRNIPSDIYLSVKK